jgi:putative NADH-flavin reductase
LICVVESVLKITLNFSVYRRPVRIEPPNLDRNVRPISSPEWRIRLRIALFGTTGPTGKYLIEEALASGDQVLVYGRNASRIRLTDNNVTLVSRQIHDSAAVANALEGVDAVISALGPGFRSPPGTVIAKGLENITDGMKKHGLKRLVQVSTASTPDHNDGAGKMKVFKFVSSLLAKNSYNDVTAAVKAIRESGLDWTIVRVPRLYDGPPTAQLRVGYYGRTPLTMKLSRGNLAKL